jgi:hypothetical protein
MVNQLNILIDSKFCQRIRTMITLFMSMANNVVALPNQMIYILNQDHINIKLHCWTFEKVDTMQRDIVTNEHSYIHGFCQNYILIDNVKFSIKVLIPNIKYLVEIMIIFSTSYMGYFDMLQSAKRFCLRAYKLRYTSFFTKCFMCCIHMVFDQRQVEII